MELTKENLIKFYLIKRMFLLIDEHFFYFWLYLVYSSEYFIIFPFALSYGLSCIYTSYTNLNLIEKIIEPRVSQSTWLMF